VFLLSILIVVIPLNYAKTRFGDIKAIFEYTFYDGTCLIFKVPNFALTCSIT